VLEESPSLKRYPAEKLDRAYTIGLNTAIDQTRLAESAFPETCPYTIEQILDPDFLPGGS
jgi:hypothetical protein